jgi:hypothetical protein
MSSVATVFTTPSERVSTVQQGTNCLQWSDPLSDRSSGPASVAPRLRRFRGVGYGFWGNFSCRTAFRRLFLAKCQVLRSEVLGAEAELTGSSKTIKGKEGSKRVKESY